MFILWTSPIWIYFGVRYFCVNTLLNVPRDLNWHICGDGSFKNSTLSCFEIIKRLFFQNYFIKPNWLIRQIRNTNNLSLTFYTILLYILYHDYLECVRIMYITFSHLAFAGFKLSVYRFKKKNNAFLSLYWRNTWQYIIGSY